MEHSLGGVEFRDRWEDTTSITSEENDVSWVVIRHTWNLGVVDVFDWVCATCVLGEGRIIVIDETRFWAEDNVLKD